MWFLSIQYIRRETETSMSALWQVWDVNTFIRHKIYRGAFFFFKYQSAFNLVASSRREFIYFSLYICWLGIIQDKKHVKIISIVVWYNFCISMAWVAEVTHCIHSWKLWCDRCLVARHVRFCFCFILKNSTRHILRCTFNNTGILHEKCPPNNIIGYSCFYKDRLNKHCKSYKEAQPYCRRVVRNFS